jgi:hypothetical protein
MKKKLMKKMKWMEIIKKTKVIEFAEYAMEMTPQVKIL